MDTPTTLLVAGLLTLFLTMGFGIWNLIRKDPEPKPEKIKALGRRHPHPGFFYDGRDPFSPEAQAEQRRKFRNHALLMLPAFIGLVLAGIGGIWLILNGIVASS